MELYSVIKNDGPADVLFWKFTGEDFRNGSQLIVAENEVALFVKDGVILETFEGGRYNLETNNFSFLDNLIAKFSGGKNVFSSKVFFINKAHSLELFWGTDSPIQVRDPRWGLMTEIKARGSYSIQIKEPKKFVLKFIANNTQWTTPEEFNEKFRTVFMQKIKSVIPKAIKESGEEILGICARQEEFAEQLYPVISDVFDEYGVRLVNFYIGALDIPANDNLRKMIDESALMNNLGNNWDRIQQRNILQTGAANNGPAGAGIGIGMGIAAGNFMGAMSGNFFNQNNTNNSQKVSNNITENISCPTCNAFITANAKFCPECGNKISMKKVFCTNCGCEISPDSKFCPECGTKIQG